MPTKRISKRTAAIVVASTPSGSFILQECSGPRGCNSVAITSENDVYCPYCASSYPKNSGTPLRNESKAKVQAAVTNRASKADRGPIVCLTCRKYLSIANTPKSIAELVSSINCPHCASGDLEDFNELSDEEQAKFAPTTMSESNTEPEPFANDTEEEFIETNTNDSLSSEGDQIKQDNMEETEDEVEDALSEASTNTEDLNELQMVSLTLKDGDTAILAVSTAGLPVFRLKKSRVHAQAQGIFATEPFYQVFKQRCADVGLLAAVHEFNGETWKPQKLASRADIEALGAAHAEKHFMPKFMECVALALEGGMKGIFSDTANSLKATLYDELTARSGIPSDKAVESIEQTIAISGMPFFTSIIAKAVELMSKPDSGLSEIKAMVHGSSGVSTIRIPVQASISAEDQEFRRRLVEGNVPVSTSEPVTNYFSRHKGGVGTTAALLAGKASTETLRDQLKLGYK